jgi:phage minor structural protein
MSQIHITDGQTDQILAVITAEHILTNYHYKSLKDSLETFHFETFADMSFSNYLGKLHNIIIQDEDGKYIEFVIFETNKYRSEDGVLITEVYSSASHQLLKKSKVIEPQVLSAQTTFQVVDFALYNTEWQPGIITYKGIKDFEVNEYTNPYSFLKRVANDFDLELQFRLEVDGNTVTGRFVDLVPQVGEWQGREIEFGKDLRGVRRIEEMDGVVTALIGLGPAREDGTRLEALVEDREALERWGRNGQHLIETYEPELTNEDMTLARLTELTQNELQNRVNAVVEYKCDVADLESFPGMENKKIRCGDTIKIKDTKFNPPLYLEARVHTQERDIIDKSKKSIELGNFIEYTEAEVMDIWRSLQKQIHFKIGQSQLADYTYDKVLIDDKDTTIYTNSTTYAFTKAQEAENNAKEYTDAVEIGGRNYVRSFDFSGWVLHSDLTVDSSHKATLNTNSWGVSYLYMTLAGNTTYYLTHRGSGRVVVREGHDIGGVTLATDEGTFTVPSNGEVTLRIDSGGSGGVYTFENIQIERGTRSTDFTPATEDQGDADVKERMKLWQFEDTTYIDGGRIYTNSITANEIAAGTITADLLDVNYLTANDLEVNGDLKFGGTLAGATGTFSGSITTPLLTVGDNTIQGYDEFGLRLQTAQWQESSTQPFVPTGHIHFDTLNNALNIYQEDNNGNSTLMEAFVVDARNTVLNGAIRLENNGEVVTVRGSTSSYMGLYTGGGRKGYLGYAAPGSNEFYIRQEATDNLRIFSNGTLSLGASDYTTLHGGVRHQRGLTSTDRWGLGYTSNGFEISPAGTGWGNYGTLYLNRSGAMTRVRGDFAVSGSKSAVVQTDNYGERLMYALETPDSRFVSYTEHVLEEGEHFIEIEPMFLETISPTDYFVVPHIQNAAEVVILERKEGKFRVWVQGHTAEVVFEVNGKRRGYEDVYMEESSDPFDEPEEDKEEEA